MKIYFATDHAGFEIKNELAQYVSQGLGYEIEDCGPFKYDAQDDYPDFIHKAATAVSNEPENTKAIILGGSGQGEAMVANRYDGVRATVYYGEPQIGQQKDFDGVVMDMLTLSREHNNANILSLGARFMSQSEIKDAVRKWLNLDFSGVDRHKRRIKKIDIIRKK